MRFVKNNDGFLETAADAPAVSSSMIEGLDDKHLGGIVLLIIIIIFIILYLQYATKHPRPKPRPI